MSFDSSLLTQLENPERYEGFIPTNFGLPVSYTDVNAHEVVQVTAGIGAEMKYGSGAVVCNFRNGYNDISLFMPTRLTTPMPQITVPGVGVIFMPWRFPFSRHRRIEVSPDLAATMSIGVLASASLCLVSNSTSTTAAAMTGEVDAVAIADATDLQKWTGSEMTSLAMSPGSSAQGKSLSRPTYMYLGPDVNGEPDPIDSTRVVRTGKNVVFTENVTGLKQAIALNFEGKLTGPVAADSVDFGRLMSRNPMRVSFKWTNAGTNSWNAYLVTLWARANSDPLLAGDSVYETSTLRYTATSTADQFVWPAQLVGHNRTLLDQGYVVAGVWLTAESGQPYQYTVEILDVYSHISYGGWRIAMWSRVGEGQNISIDFKGKVAGVPVGLIAPYVKQASNDEITFQEFQHLRRLFARGILQRVSYGHNSVSVGRELTTTGSVIEAAGRKRAGAAMSAAGMYRAPSMSAAGMYSDPVMNAGLIRDFGDTVGNLWNTGINVLDKIIPT